MDTKSYIDDLFRYLETFENRYTDFDTEAFLQTYNGIYTVFQPLRQQREEALAIDRYLLEKIKEMPLTSSDLRQVTIQVLVTFFESEADIDGQSNKAYLYVRDLRAVKRDVAFFENHLVPLLFRDGALNNNFELNKFFLKEIARYVGKFGGGLKTDVSPEAFGGKDDPLKFLELMRRRQVMGTELITDRGSLEFHLMQIDAFSKLASKNRLFDQYLTDWQYLKKTTFWSRVKEWFGNVWSGFRATFKSTRYFRLVMTQRPSGYIFYGAVIILFIFLAVYVPLKWSDYGNQKLEIFQQKAGSTSASGR